MDADEQEKIFGDLGQIFGDLFAGGAKATSGRGADLRMSSSLTLVEAMHGVRRTLEVERRRPCTRCDGKGGGPGATLSPCARCQGSGRISVQNGMFQTVTPCPECRGLKGRWSEPCSACEGTGDRRDEVSIELTVPPGVRPGQRLRLAGQGNPPRSSEPGPDGKPPTAGDLYVVIELALPAGLTIEGDHLVARVRLDPEKARRGGILTVPWIDGSARVAVPPNTAHGARITKRGWGLLPVGTPFRPPSDDGTPYRAPEPGERGDLLVEIHLGGDLDALLEAELAATPPSSLATSVATGPPREARIAFGLVAAIALGLGYYLLTR
ncbi:MAG: hypothetical protein K1X94_04430 [Sandaracinaceae bacterium]|nr:hypothetical protein [Sandaracinaceae bacterium]